MKKRYFGIVLTFALLIAALSPLTVSKAAAVKNGYYSANIGKAVWIIQVKKKSGDKVKIGVAWSDDKSAFETGKLITRTVKDGKVSFSVKGITKPDTGSKKISGTITFKGKKLKCVINGQKFTAKKVTDGSFS